MDAATKAYLLFDSPLRTSRGRIALTLILLAIFVLAVIGRNDLGVSTLLHAYAWMGYTLLGSLIVYAVLSFLDCKRAIVRFHLIVVAAVALESAFVALFLNDRSPRPLQTVGFVEEGVKILPALLLAIFVPNLIRTRKDAIVYGGMGGLGFNIIETALYITQQSRSAGQSIQSILFVQDTRFGYFGFGVHVIWSMFVGFGLGMTVTSTRTGWRKWRPFVLTYLLVAVVHSSYDSILLGIFLLITTVLINVVRGGGANINSIMADPAKPGPLHDAMRLESILYNFVFIVILIRQLFRSAASEQAIYVAQLAEEPDGVISTEEQALLAEEGRWRMRRYPEYTRRVSKQIVKLQNLLAMQKHVLTREGRPVADSEVVRLFRERIVALRSRPLSAREVPQRA